MRVVLKELAASARAAASLAASASALLEDRETLVGTAWQAVANTATAKRSAVVPPMSLVRYRLPCYI